MGFNSGFKELTATDSLHSYSSALGCTGTVFYSHTACQDGPYEHTERWNYLCSFCAAT